MKVLVATKERKVFDVLKNKNVKGLESIAALDTQRIYENIPSIQIAIVDNADLIPQPFSVDLIGELLKAAPLQLCTSSEFQAAPDTYLGKAGQPTRASRLPSRLPPKRTLVFTSYSGGTGRTSLALDTALHFAKKTKNHLPLSVAVFEFTHGSSALQALVGGERPTLYDLVLQPEAEPSQFNGVTLFPSGQDILKPLPPEQISNYCRQQIANHVLTVIDANWPNLLTSSIGDEVDLWVVLTTPRVDAVENARKLYRELASERGEERVIIAVNQMGGLGAALALAGTHRDIEIPRVQRSETLFGGRLGKKILDHLYNSLWQEYERTTRRPFWRRA